MVNETHKVLWYFKIQSSDLGQMTKPSNSLPKKKEKGGNYRKVNFGVPEVHKEKFLKKQNSYRNFDREQKIWKMKVTVIPIIIDALGIITQVLVKGQKNL